MEHNPTSSAHTPGPWTISYYDADNKSPDSPSAYRIDTAENFEALADVFERCEKGEDLANARLIAAAPDLLEACYYASGFVQAWEKENGPTDLVRKVIENALAKAEGR